MGVNRLIVILGLLLFLFSFAAGCVSTEIPSGKTITVIDDLGREVVIPSEVKTVGASGSGSARYVVYLDALDMLIGVDSTDNSTVPATEGRPYMLAHPEIAKLPLLGASKASIDAELALALSPDVIIYSVEGNASAAAADEAYAKTGIPIVCFNQYDPANQFDRFAKNILLLGTVLGKQERADAVVAYFSAMKTDLISRTPDIPLEEKPVVYLGGVSNRGTHGMVSTKPEFIGFTLLSANHKAADIGDMASANIAKEKILEWNPAIVFVDLGTLRAAGGGALVELKTDPAYQGLTAVTSGSIYTVMPDTSCKTNHGTSFANAYFVGTVLYPGQFADIDAKEKADEIYSFLVGKPVFTKMYANTGSLGYQKIDLAAVEEEIPK